MFSLAVSPPFGQAGLPLLAQSGGSYWLPPQESTTAGAVDSLFYFILAVAAFFFLLIVGVMVTFVIRYRRRPGVGPETSPSHNTPLEVAWSVIPLIIVIIIFAWGFVGYMEMRTSPRMAYEVNVTAQRWGWNFQYANGHEDNNLHVPVERPIRLVMTSKDIIHSLFIPAFRVKMDLVPGRYTTTWFQALNPGEYDLYCAEYCGQGHSDMLSRVVVHPPGEFDSWLERAANLLETMSPVEAGELLFRRKLCASCHSLQGARLVGPSLQGIFGKTHRFTDGTSAVVDENYLRESMLEPGNKIRQGYPNQMSTYKGRIKDREIGAIIEYIKSLK
ncbi:MAG: cytochrome c oxidase subunit II [Planctomycetota bacterium]|jgi:cytochrome c oxidase subunit 2